MVMIVPAKEWPAKTREASIESQATSSRKPVKGSAWTEGIPGEGLR